MLIEKTCWISSAHILLDYHGVCGRLHGHNWKIIIGIEGEPAINEMIVDFNDIKEIVNRYDHKIILPGENKRVNPNASYVVLIKDSNYRFPARDCVFIPFSRVTAENLAKTLKIDIEDYITRNDLQAKVKSITVYETENNMVRIE